MTCEVSCRTHPHIDNGNEWLQHCEARPPPVLQPSFASGHATRTREEGDTWDTRPRPLSHQSRTDLQVKQGSGTLGTPGTLSVRPGRSPRARRHHHRPVQPALSTGPGSSTSACTTCGTPTPRPHSTPEWTRRSWLTGSGTPTWPTRSPSTRTSRQAKTGAQPKPSPGCSWGRVDVLEVRGRLHRHCARRPGVRDLPRGGRGQRVCGRQDSLLNNSGRLVRYWGDVSARAVKVELAHVQAPPRVLEVRPVAITAAASNDDCVNDL